MTRLHLPLRWGSSRPGTIQPPPHSPWWVESSRDDSTPPPTTRPRGPPPPIPLHGVWGPPRRPCGTQRFPPLPRVLLLPIPADLLFSTLAPSSTNGVPASPPRRPSRRYLSCRRSRRPSYPPVALSPQFLACPMATPSAGRVSPHPPPSQLPTWHRSPAPPDPPLTFGLPLSPPPHLPQAPAAARPPPHALLPPPPAAKIAQRDEDVGNRTGEVVARRPLAGGSAPHGECSRSPRAVVVGDGISRLLFRHLPQQWHPMHCLPELRHLHARDDRPMVEQVECWLQLQHRSTISQARR